MKSSLRPSKRVSVVAYDICESEASAFAAVGAEASGVWAQLGGLKKDHRRLAHRGNGVSHMSSSNFLMWAWESASLFFNSMSFSCLVLDIEFQSPSMGRAAYLLALADSVILLGALALLESITDVLISPLLSGQLFP